MNEKFDKNAKVEQLTQMFLSHEEEKALPLKILYTVSLCLHDVTNVLNHESLSNKHVSIFTAKI